jgi:hypothetical protein
MEPNHDIPCQTDLINFSANFGEANADSGDAVLLYHFDHRFTNSENLVSEMADKFSFEFYRF